MYAAISYYSAQIVTMNRVETCMHIEINVWGRAEIPQELSKHEFDRETFLYYMKINHPVFTQSLVTCCNYS